MRKTLNTIAKLSLAVLPVLTMAATEEITIWAWDPNFNVAIMDEAKTRYLADHPGANVTFKIVDFSKDDVEQKLLTNLASGVTRSLPDIVLVEDYKAQSFLQAFPGSFEAMNDRIDYSKFAPYKVALGTVNGKTYSLPFDTGVTGLFYRTDILASAGYGAEDLENITWDRYIEIGKDVRAKTGKYMFTIDPNDGSSLRWLMHSANAWFFDEKGNLDIENNPALMASLELYIKLQESGISRPANGWSDWVSGVSNGDVASIVSGVWFIGTIKSLNQPGQWAIAPIPRMDGVEGAANASNWGGSSWYVLSSSKAKQTAVDFLEHVYANDLDFYDKILTERGAVGSFLPSQTSAAYSMPDAYFGGQPIFADFAKWSAQIPAIDFGMYTYEVTEALVAQVPSIMRGGSIERALKAAAAQASSQMQ